MKVILWFDGIRWAAKRAGFPGVVFADTEREAIARANGWEWRHLSQRELARKRSQP